MKVVQMIFRPSASTDVTLEDGKVLGLGDDGSVYILIDGEWNGYIGN